MKSLFSFAIVALLVGNFVSAPVWVNADEPQYYYYASEEASPVAAECVVLDTEGDYIRCLIAGVNEDGEGIVFQTDASKPKPHIWPVTDWGEGGFIQLVF